VFDTFQTEHDAVPQPKFGTLVVMAVVRLLTGLGFKVVVECCMVLAGAPSSYNVYARRPQVDD
jgi:hypothetical protein